MLSFLTNSLWLSAFKFREFNITAIEAIRPTIDRNNKYYLENGSFEAKRRTFSSFLCGCSVSVGSRELTLPKDYRELIVTRSHRNPFSSLKFMFIDQFYELQQT